MTEKPVASNSETQERGGGVVGHAKLSRRALIAIATVSVLVLTGAGIGTAYALGAWSSGADLAATREAAPTATPTASPDLPFAPEAMFRGAVEGWQIPTSAEIAAVLPSAGSAHTGQVALAIDAPALRQPTGALTISATVEPGVTYQFSAWVQLQTAQPTVVPAAFVVGDVVIPIPESAAEWREVRAEVVAPAGATTLQMSLRVDAPVTGLSIDDISLGQTGGENLIANPSFEAVQAVATIANDSLVMSADTAVIAAALPEGHATWVLTDEAGRVTASGSVTAAGPVTAIELDGAPQGYHTLVVTDAAGNSVTTPIALVDTKASAIRRDQRFGVTAQFDRAQHAGGGRLAAALGYGDIHADVLWSRNEKRAGQYAWDPAYVTEFTSARANGLSTVGVIAYGNKLYDGGLFPTSSGALDAFGRYAAAATQTFSLSAVEVFNEPNRDRFNKGGCGTAPTCYIPLLDSVRTQFTAQGISVPIIGGATALYDQAWFQAFWQAGGMDHIDVLSYHPYEAWIERNPDLMRPTVAQSLADMRQFAGGTKPVWITEMGFTTMTGGVTREQQRDWLIRSAALAFAGGVEKFMWYDIVDDGVDPANGEGNFGLYEHAPRPGVAVVAPKQSAFGQALLVAQLDGRALGGDESDAVSNVVRFGDVADAVRVAWSVGESSEWTFSSKAPVQVVSSTGVMSTIKPVNGKITVPLTQEPVFVSMVMSD